MKSKDATLALLASLAANAALVPLAEKVGRIISKDVSALLAAKIGRIKLKDAALAAKKVGFIGQGADGIKSLSVVSLALLTAKDAALALLAEKVGFIGRGAYGIKSRDAALALALLVSLAAKDGRIKSKDAALASLVQLAAKVRFIGRGAD